MHTGNTAIAQKSRKNSFDRRRKEINQSGDHEYKKDDTPIRIPANDFLKTVFKKKKISEVPNSPYNEVNYLYLYRSAKNYAKLLGKELNIKSNDRNLELLYRNFNSILPDMQESRLTLEDGILKFKVYDIRNDGYHFHIPCRIIDEASGLFREILIQFFYLLQHNFYLQEFKESRFIEFMFQMADENDEPDNEYYHLVQEYQAGAISDTLDLISNKNIYTVGTLIKLLKKFKPYTQREKSMCEIINKGLYFMKRKRSIGTMAVPPDVDDYEASYSVDVGDLLIVVYDDDQVTQEYNFQLNESANEYGFDYFSAGIKELSPYTRKLMQLDNYVVDFINWIIELNDELYFL